LEELKEQKKKKKKNDRKKKMQRIAGVIDDNPIKHEESDTESEESDTENENPDFDIVLEPNKRQQEIMNIANNKYKIVEEDDDRSDKMSVYSRRVIRNAMNKKDNDTDSSKTIKTSTLSQYAAFLSNKENIPSPIDIDKTDKAVATEFYFDSYYMAIHKKNSYYPADNYSIFAHGFNDYIYQFFVEKKSRIVK
jgi:hypothetical protein